MKEPANKQIKEAKDFVIQRVRAEISIQSHLDELLMQATKEIIAISLKYNIVPQNFRFSANVELQSEVDEVMRKLRKLIYDYTETLSVYNRKEDKEEIIGFINRENKGKTLSERINIYCNRYKYEIEAAIAAGLLSGISKDKIEESIKRNLNSPYNNPYFRNAVDKSESVATRIQTGGISYGVGKSNSARNSLKTLTRFTIGAAWMYFWGLSGSRSGAKGFYSYRGSSYPCAYCDDMVGYHPMEEYQEQWHVNCMCFFVFV